MMLKKRSMYRKFSEILGISFLMLIATIFMLPRVVLAATEPTYHEWDKAQEHVGLSHLWFTDRADNGLIPVRQNWKWGFINYQGKFVIKPQFQLARDAFYQGVAVVNRNQLINSKGKVIFQDKSIEYIGLFNNGLAIAKKNGKIGYLNTNGKFVISPTYEEGTSFYNQAALVKKNGKWALINTKGKLLTTFNIEDKEFGTVYRKSGLFPVKINGLWGSMNYKGQLVVPAEFKNKIEFRGNTLEWGHHRDKYSAIVRQDGLIISFDKQYSRIGEPQNGLWKIQDSGEGIVDVSGHMIVEPQDDQKILLSGDGSYAVRDMKDESSGWTFYKKDQTLLFESNYTDIQAFSEDLAAVKLNQKWGFVSKKGDIKIPAQYEEANLFQMGSAAIRKNGKYGLIGTRGEAILPAKYDEIVPLIERTNYMNNQIEKVTTKNPLYRVKLKKNYGIVDSRGKIVMDVKYEILELERTDYYHDIDPIATIQYALKAKDGSITTSFNIKTGKLIFPTYALVNYLGDGMYSGVPLGNNSKYVIFNAKGKEVFRSGFDG
ncbi:WG repeat-containing protein [Paenibacillus amylolyticus]|uniref:WG repeat-containing protein n=1 Tax=Paenibacillus amylolyticus TaxID=1451 RepID=UPI00201D6B1F|nr:WG repeat-containing protein [Paenibacillus amylolyticus]MCL6663383.1 WG repeat-containing protein [Paenibacillus amylolyticus]